MEIIIAGILVGVAAIATVKASAQTLKPAPIPVKKK
jgi:hypothetical protein